jgi:hypothetical protein
MNIGTIQSARAYMAEHWTGNAPPETLAKANAHRVIFHLCIQMVYRTSPPHKHETEHRL